MSKLRFEDIKNASHGRWDEIFPQFSITMPRKKRHAPCPACGGSDRFRYDDKKGYGDFYCNHCGPGDGFALVDRCTNLSTSEVFQEVANILGLSKDSKITDNDRKRWKKEAEMRERMRIEEEQRMQLNTAKKAEKLWQATHEGDSSPYLIVKKVDAFGVKVNFDGDVLVPLYDKNRKLMNQQYIKPDGSKTFLTGGKVKGCFHWIGTVDLKDPIVCIAEGYATAASIHMATSLPIAVAFNAGNLLPVGQAIRELEPFSKILYCADDDSAKEDTGRECAEEAVAVTGGLVTIPKFASTNSHIKEGHTGEQPKAFTDFNDLHVNFGLEEVRKQIEQAIALPFSPAPLLPQNNKNEGQNGVIEQTIDKTDFVVNQEKGAGEATDAPYVLDIDSCLARFCVIEGESKYWDMHRKKQIKKSAFIEMLGKELFKQWSEHHKRKIIDSDAVKNILNESNDRLAKDLMDRFVMLEGTQESWDTHRRERTKNVTIKDNFRAGFDIWIKSDQKKMIYHKDLVFNPTMQVKEGQINMFDGLPTSPMLDDSEQMISSKNSQEMCLPILKLLAQTCNQEREAIIWILKWLAYPLQNQGAKMATSILMHGEVQGAGKSLFFGKVMREIYGKYCVTLGQNGLESIYTDWAEQKLYCVFEEIFNNKSKYGMMGLIKHMITGETVRIEKKFMSGYEQSNHINCVFLSNDTQPLPLEEKDRRFLVIWPKKKLDEALKNDVIKCIENGGTDAFYTYLLQLPLDGFTTHTEPPMTSAKKDIIQYGLPGWKLFLQQWKNEELDYPFVSCLSTDLFSAYMSWCRHNSEKPLPSNKFLSQISTQAGIVKKHGRYYEGDSYNKKTQKQKMVIYVGDPPENEKLIDWLTSQIEQFSAKLHGDMPHAINN